ncbi:hypothetical protein CBR_g22052 [Chara braunii]|uniref:Uncharacterized protein n=1 Tax=Chara braunii TaxID=69332 RepID=A0A388L1V8_CHABU|nr:hypothetical protein CBR_g22052 [Chara braunii]|eukprot:GBG76304.1 hypothetical protein CBR_g22052 [Chara braunii]
MALAWYCDAWVEGGDRSARRRVTRQESLSIPIVHQAVATGGERALRQEAVAERLQSAREAAAAAEQTLAEARATAAAMATSAATSASTSGQTRLGMPDTSQATSSSSSQIMGSQYSSPPPRTREAIELQQMELIRLRLEKELREATERPTEIRTRNARLENREAVKAAVEGLDDAVIDDNTRILKAGLLSVHAYMDSKLDAIQDTFDQILSTMQGMGRAFPSPTRGTSFQPPVSHRWVPHRG